MPNERRDDVGLVKGCVRERRGDVGVPVVRKFRRAEPDEGIGAVRDQSARIGQFRFKEQPHDRFSIAAPRCAPLAALCDDLERGKPQVVDTVGGTADTALPGRSAGAGPAPAVAAH